MTLEFRSSFFRSRTAIAASLLIFAATRSSLVAKEISKPYGLNARPESKAYLLMPEHGDGALPKLRDNVPRRRPMTGRAPSAVFMRSLSAGHRS